MYKKNNMQKGYFSPIKIINVANFHSKGQSYHSPKFKFEGIHLSHAILRVRLFRIFFGEKSLFSLKKINFCMFG